MPRLNPPLAVRLMLSVVAVFVVAFFSGAASAETQGAAPSAAKSAPPGVVVNACGCYRTDSGACLCGDKKAKCGCPGDCEPIKCDAQRAREVDKEIAAETKKAQEEEKKWRAAEAAREARENTVVQETGAADDRPDQDAAEVKKAPRKTNRGAAGKPPSKGE